MYKIQTFITFFLFFAMKNQFHYYMYQTIFLFLSFNTSVEKANSVKTFQPILFCAHLRFPPLLLQHVLENTITSP